MRQSLIYKLTLNRPGFLQIGMDGGGGADYAPLYNFCLNGPIDLEIWHVDRYYVVKFLNVEKKIRKQFARKLLKTLISAFLEGSFHRNRAFTRNAQVSLCVCLK